MAVEKEAWIPKRAVLGVLLFFISAASYMHSSNMGVIIVNMVIPPETSIVGDPKCVSVNTTRVHKVAPPSDISERYDWSQVVQSIMLGIYYIGYAITHIPGGLLSEKYGARRITFWTSIVSCVCTAIIPICADVHYGLVIVLRFIIGLCGGVVYPAMHAAIARWVPPHEKSKFVWCTIGGTFGTMITFPLCGLIMNSLGWEAAFYFTAIYMLVVAMAWFFFMSDTPQQHPSISKKELQYIESAIGKDISKESPKLPTKKIFTSIPVFAAVLLQIGDVWGLFFPMSYGPKYLKEALGFDIQQTGGLSALPYLGRLVFGVVFSAITDFLHARHLMSTTRLRKLMTLFSHLVPAVFLFLVGVAGCSPYLSLTFLTLSLGFNGAAVGSCLANAHDLAPNYAGTIFGIQNGVASVFSAFSGFIAGGITHEKSGLAEWQLIWGIGGGVYVATGVAFLIWGTGERQEWNEPMETTEETPTTKMEMSDTDNKQATNS